MPDYGGYDLRRPHALAALASVYEAVANDGRPGRFALKLFHPPPSTNVRRLYAIEGWLLAAERQRAVAQAGGAAVEILACGRCAEGAYAVMPWREHPFGPLAWTLGAKGDLLRAVAERLLDGLTAWEAHGGGPHGKLKPSNVFLSGSGELAGLSVELADPWFVPGAKPDELRARDLAAIGGILTQIVRRRAVAGGWPIEEAPEWRALGRVGGAWLAYCNYLLNPQPAEGELTLAEARRRLQDIARDPRPVRTTLVITGVVAALVAGGLTGFARYGDPQVMPHMLRRLAETTGNPRAFRTEVTPDWAKLCRAWGSWLGDLQRNADRWERTAELWAPDDPLRAALTRFRGAAANLRPQALVSAAAKETRLGVLADAPPDPVRRELLRGTVAESVTEAWTQVDALTQQLEKWPRWDELRHLLELLDARGFKRAAAVLHGRLPPVRTADGSGPDVSQVLKWFNDLSMDDAGSLSVASRWGEISRLTAEMTASGDRIQQAMPPLILARLSDHPSLGDFADSLADPLGELQRRRAQFLDPAVVRERFLRESSVQTETAAPTEVDFPRWEQELKLFSHVPAPEDPRASPEIDTRVARLTTSASDLEREAPAGEAGGAPALSRADFDREIDRLRGNLKTLRSREIVRHDLPVVTTETGQLVGAVRVLEVRLDGTLALLRPDFWLRRVAEPVGQLGAAIQRWTGWRQTALAGVTAAVLERDRPRFRALRDQERTLRAWVEGLEGPDGFGGLPKPDASLGTPDTAGALQRLETARREKAADAVVAAAEWRNALPAAPWPAAGPSVRAPIEAHRRWLNELPEFGKELDQLGGLLSEGHGWNEGVDGVVAQLDRHEGVNALSGRPAEWLGEARQLSQLATTSDRAALTGATRLGGLSRKLTAWRRLGALGGWPAGASELDVEGEMVAMLREVIGRDVKDESRRRGLSDELTREGRARWNRAARSAARRESELATIFKGMGRFGIAEQDLDEPVAYNLRLWRLKDAVQNETDLDRLRSQRDTFAAAVRSMGGASGRPEVSAFLQKLDKIELALDVVDTAIQAVAGRSVLGSLLKTVDPRELVKGAVRKPTLSPRLAGWHEELADAGMRVSATWSSGGHNLQLEFLLVQPDDDTPPFYLAGRVIAVGEFLDLVSARPEGKKVIAALPQWTRGTSLDQPWNKPMAWRPRADFRGLELNPTWFYLTDAQVKALFDNAELRGRTPVLEQAVAEQPTLRSPLQQVPPEAARLFAETLLGARLPRPQEWRAAVKLLGAPPAGNFRGRSFQELWRFLDDYRVGGQIVRWRPNEGVFLPLVEPPGGGPRMRFADDGQARAGSDANRLWLAPVDEGPTTGGFVNLTGNVWIYLYDAAAKQYYVAGGSALAPPGIDFTAPFKVEAAGRVGARTVTEGFSDVGIRPAFDAPPGIRERFELLRLVREQQYLTL